MRILFSLTLLFFLYSCSQKKEELFKLLPSEKTHIKFNNNLTEGPNTNILVYEYFYNGGGVATADFNNDGLDDIYFTANMTSNKLYINEGNMQFRDVTDISKAGGRPGPWKTGVSVIDINNDGLLDLYLCYSGALPSEKRANQLLVNKGLNANKEPVFEDQAEKYGIASTAYSNQAFFFDYDHDNDLDMVLMNHNPKSLPILNIEGTRDALKIDDKEIGCRLYKQENGIFQDVTPASGINGSALSYGLGLGLADFNDDGWIDFYLSNDYAVPDYLYINNQNGTFTNKINEYLNHISEFSMGNDVADVNNDGRVDIFTLDMLPEDNYRQKLLVSPDNYAKFNLNVKTGFHYQYMRNMLQLNNGDGTFSEVGQIEKISNTDWSWSPLFADFDNDGFKDLFVTNGYLKDYTNLDFIKYMDNFVQTKGTLKREDLRELLQKMPASNVVNYAFKNENGKSFLNKTTDWGFNRPSNSNGAAYSDLDNDGDLDYVVNNVNQEAFIYENQSKNTNYIKIKLKGIGSNSMAIGAKVSLKTDSNTQLITQTINKGYLSAVSPIIHFGLGSSKKINQITIQWNTGLYSKLSDVNANQLIEIDESKIEKFEKKSETPSTYFNQISSPLNYKPVKKEIVDFNRQPLLIDQFSYSSPKLIKGDINNDGLEDIVLGGDANELTQVYLQNSAGNFSEIQSNDFIQDKPKIDAALALFDANKDGNLDLYIGSGGYDNLNENDPLLADRFYLGNGKGQFTKLENALPQVFNSASCIAVNDINNDGFPDLFVGSRVIPGKYPMSPKSSILINDKKGNFKLDENNPLAELGMITDAKWLDLNNDKNPELVLVGEWMPVYIFGNKNGKLSNETSNYLKENLSGRWNTILGADINQDGKTDLVLGNQGLNNQFEAPMEMFYDDFDKNGLVDPIFVYAIQGKKYPSLMRDELFLQMGGFKSRYTTFESYANQTAEDIFGKDALKSAKKLKVTELESICLINKGKFEKVSLPIEAQYSPIFAIESLDINQDGKLDLVLAGNQDKSKLRFGKFDANHGLILFGKGDGNFETGKFPNQYLGLQGSVRSSLMIKDKIYFGINQEGIKAYVLNPN